MTTISTKKFQRIMQTMRSDTISKTEFAKRVGISTPTLYAWIRKNLDGIADFVTEDGISVKIFETEAWKKYNDEDLIETQRLQSDITDLNEDLDRAANQIDALNAEIAGYKIRLEAMEQTVEILKDQIATKDAQIQALLVSLNQQIKALPMPKLSWREQRALKRQERLERKRQGQE